MFRIEGERRGEAPWGGREGIFYPFPLKAKSTLYLKAIFLWRGETKAHDTFNKMHLDRVHWWLMKVGAWYRVLKGILLGVVGGRGVEGGEKVESVPPNFIIVSVYIMIYFAPIT